VETNLGEVLDPSSNLVILIMLGKVFSILPERPHCCTASLKTYFKRTFKR